MVSIQYEWIKVYKYKQFSYKMEDEFMFSHTNRFASNLHGYAKSNSRYNNQQFEHSNATQPRQFHELQDRMPTDVLQLFKANDISFLKAPVKPRCRALDPVATCCPRPHDLFSVPTQNPIEVQPQSNKEEMKEQLAEERQRKHMLHLKSLLDQWNPFIDPKITSDPEKTLLVARLDYSTTEKGLKFEFEKYGIIKSVRVVRDGNEKSRGYAFVEFDNREDCVAAFKQANHRKIDGRRIIVDLEKGRTLLSWRPRMLGKGTGELRLTKLELEEMRETARARKARKAEKERRDNSRSKSHKKKHSKKRSSWDRKEKKEKKQKKEKKEKNEKVEEEGEAKMIVE